MVIHPVEGLPKGTLIILGTPSPVVLDRSQTEPTFEQIIKSYLSKPRERAIITGINEEQDQ